MNEYFEVFILMAVAVLAIGFVVWLLAWLFIASVFAQVFGNFSSQVQVKEGD